MQILPFMNCTCRCLSLPRKNEKMLKKIISLHKWDDCQGTRLTSYQWHVSCDSGMLQRKPTFSSANYSILLQPITRYYYRVSIYSLENMKDEMWGEQVDVISCDMRFWNAPEKADILVSELLNIIIVFLFIAWRTWRTRCGGSRWTSYHVTWDSGTLQGKPTFSSANYSILLQPITRYYYLVSIYSLENMKNKMWWQQVDVISCDMRFWNAPEKADILVSELLDIIIVFLFIAWRTWRMRCGGSRWTSYHVTWDSGTLPKKPTSSSANYSILLSCFYL